MWEFAVSVTAQSAVAVESDLEFASPPAFAAVGFAEVVRAATAAEFVSLPVFVAVESAGVAAAVAAESVFGPASLLASFAAAPVEASV